MSTGIPNNYAKASQPASRANTSGMIDSARPLFKKAPEKLDDEGNVVPEEAPASIGLLPDIRSDAKQWEWAGVSFGEFDLMLLQKNLKKHINTTGASQMNLWGKIRGTHADYFIAEGTLDAGEDEGAADPENEKRGEGVNKYVYWATNKPLGEWT